MSLFGPPSLSIYIYIFFTFVCIYSLVLSMHVEYFIMKTSCFIVQCNECSIGLFSFKVLKIGKHHTQDKQRCQLIVQLFLVTVNQ